MILRTVAIAGSTVLALVWPLSRVSGAQPVIPAGIWMDHTEIAALPTSGAAWINLVENAQKPCSIPNLSDSEDSANVCVLAKALVFAREGNPTYRLNVIDALRSIVNANVYDGRALALGRELAAYVIAADLIDLKVADPDLDSHFRVTIRGFLTTPLISGPANLIECHEKRANNWGTHCGASRVAVAAYLGDVNELARVAQVFKGWLGDRTSYAGFSYGDLSWQCDENNPVGVNPAGCTKEGHSVDGVLPDDQRRAGIFTWPPPQENYVYGALQGALAQAVILNRAGYPAFEWENRALLRAFAWLHTQAQYLAAGDDTWQPHVVNYYYEDIPLKFPAPIPSSPGKNVGWTDWTHGDSSYRPQMPWEYITNPSADTFVRGEGAKNLGSSRTLEVLDASNDKEDRRTFLRFDLRALGSTASSAILKMHVSGLPSGTSVSICTFGVNSDGWSESGLSWKNQPAVGMMLSCQDISVNGWVSFDVTRFVQQVLADDKVASLALLDTKIINRLVQFDSRETSNPPVLTVKVP